LPSGEKVNLVVSRNVNTVNNIAHIVLQQGCGFVFTMYSSKLNSLYR